MNPEHVAIVKQGAEAIQEWRKRNSLEKFDLSHANLSGTNLNHAHLSGADLSHVDFSRATLSHVDLYNADLRYAELNNANLCHADLSFANLSLAHLNGADLTHVLLVWANLYMCTLDSANLTRAICGYTILGGGVDLSRVKGLDTINHHSTSSIDIATLYRSGGKIPEAFLRGCGVPEEFIRFLPSLINAESAIQFYSCFISYSHKDEEFAKRLFDRLQGAGIRVWYAPEEMKGGMKLHEQIYEGIRLRDKLLLVLSEHSLASEWVTTEIRRTRKAEREQKKQKLFPISLMDDFDAVKNWECFDADSGKDLGVELREYFIPDFSNWKDHDSFEKAFERLLKDLRAGSKPPAEDG